MNRISTEELRRNIIATAEYIGSVYQRSLKRKRLYDRGEAGDEYPTMAYESDMDLIATVEGTLRRCKAENRTDIYLGYLSEYPNEKAKANFKAVNEFVQLMQGQ